MNMLGHDFIMIDKFLLLSCQQELGVFRSAFLWVCDFAEKCIHIIIIILFFIWFPCWIDLIRLSIWSNYVCVQLVFPPYFVILLDIVDIVFKNFQEKKTTIVLLENAIEKWKLMTHCKETMVKYGCNDFFFVFSYSHSFLLDRLLHVFAYISFLLWFKVQHSPLINIHRWSTFTVRNLKKKLSSYRRFEHRMFVIGKCVVNLISFSAK